MFSSERNLHTAAGEKDHRAEAARKASRQRYKLKCKKQIRMGRSGRMPPHSCMRGSSITQCEFITWTDRWAEKRGGGHSRSEGPKNLGALVLTDWRAHRWVSRMLWIIQLIVSRSLILGVTKPLGESLSTAWHARSHPHVNKSHTHTPQSSASRQQKRLEWVIYITRL